VQQCKDVSEMQKGREKGFSNLLKEREVRVSTVE
jgi:hypothetical protein